MPYRVMLRTIHRAAAATTATLGAVGLASDGAVAQGRAAPIFENGQAQIVPAFQDSTQWIREELWVETEVDSDRDGKRDRVHVAIVRQRQTETEGLRVPVIYESSPYFSGVAGFAGWDVRHGPGETPPDRTPPPPVRTRIRPGIANSHVNTWVPRGFAVAHSEAPGTGLSEGCPTVGGPAEILAPKAVVDWLNGRARGFTTVDGDTEVAAGWSTGKVGMTGTSYNGTIPLAAATTGVDGLEVIVPVSPNTSYYQYYRANGLVRSPGGYLGEDMDVLYDFIHSGDPDRRDHCNAIVRDTELANGMDRVTGDYNEFWAGRDLWNRLDGVHAATLLAHGFNDWNVMPLHSVRVYEVLKARGVPAAVYFHQGGHGGMPPAEMMNRWFTRYLYGIANGVENDPRAWIVREDAERSNPTPYPDYPNPEAAPVTLHLAAGGVQTGGLGLSAAPAQGTETLVDNFSFDGATLARAEWTDHRLLYVTPELTRPVHLSGTAHVTIRVASSAPAANLTVWLVSLPWSEGRRTPNGQVVGARGGAVTRGWVDPQNRSSLTESAPLVPGEFVELAFDLEPDDQIVAQGQRIGLMIFSSDREYTLWSPPGTELTVDLDATSITLPVVGGAATLREAFGNDGG